MKKEDYKHLLGEVVDNHSIVFRKIGKVVAVYNSFYVISSSIDEGYNRYDLIYKDHLEKKCLVCFNSLERDSHHFPQDYSEGFTILTRKVPNTSFFKKLYPEYEIINKNMIRVRKDL